jgi:predicted MPP superfamily phosphohydrolase
MLHIREVSDMHLEFYYDLYDSTVGRAKEELSKLIPPLPTDKKTVLIVAGDLATARRAGRIVTFMELIHRRFAHVIYVLGNHEHYDGEIHKTLSIIEQALKDCSTIDMSRITLAGNDIVVKEIKGVRFLCGTLWTDYGRGSPTAAKMVPQYIRDHKCIRDEDGNHVTTQYLGAIHAKALATLESLMDGRDNSKTVVVTHHMPSFQAVHPMYMLDNTTRVLNAAFSSDLDYFIMIHKPAYWFFGHTHTKFKGKVGDTMLVCNPLGYPQERNVEKGVFNSDEVFSL